MKTRCIIFLLLSVSMALCACNAQRRAERRIRRIVERCPELLSEQAHAIDTFLPVAPVADSAAMPLRPLLAGETFTVTTPKGTFTASIDDDTLSIAYDAQLDPIHFADTVYLPQVVIEAKPENKKPPNLAWFLFGVVIVLLAVIVTAITIVIKMVKSS